MSAKTLQITDEKVRAMAAKCPDAARVLREGFPEAFGREDGFAELYASNVVYDKAGTSNYIATMVTEGNFRGAALIPGSGYSAQIVTDNLGRKVVVFAKKTR